MKYFDHYRNEVKSHTIRIGMSMTEAVELADVLEYDIVWQRRKGVS